MAARAVRDADRLSSAPTSDLRQKRAAMPLFFARLSLLRDEPDGPKGGRIVPLYSSRTRLTRSTVFLAPSLRMMFAR